MKVEIMTITPDKARELLKGNVLHSKQLRLSKVKSLAKKMASGEWIFPGKPITLSDKLGVIDGQHRLHAIVKSNTTQDFAVAKVDRICKVIVNENEVQRQYKIFKNHDTNK